MGMHWFSVIENGEETVRIDVRNPNIKKWNLQVDWRDIEISGKLTRSSKCSVLFVLYRRRNQK